MLNWKLLKLPVTAFIVYCLYPGINNYKCIKKVLKFSTLIYLRAVGYNFRTGLQQMAF